MAMEGVNHCKTRSVLYMAFLERCIAVLII